MEGHNKKNELNHDKWAGTTYGSGWMHRWLIQSLRIIDVRLLYIFTFIFVLPPTMIVNSKATKAIYRFYRKGMAYGRLKAAWMAYKNHCAFSQVVIDRFAMYAGKRFNLTVDGYEEFVRLCRQPEGFIQLSSHIGNYELAGYSLKAKEKRFNAMVFGGEKESVMDNRNKMFEENNIRMIPMKADMSHLFVINQAISDGEILSMPADRIFGSQKYFALDFLGHTARFPMGPFQLGAAKDAEMLFVAVMKTGAKKYMVTVRRLDSPKGNSTREKALDLAHQYADLLEKTVRKHPAQWYNYFDFWAENVL